MTTPTYSVNSGTQIHGVTAAWDNEPLRQNDDGTMAFSPWLRHVWTIPVIGMTAFLELQAAQGEVITSVETNDYTDPNAAATYTDVTVGAINGRHQGLNVRDVTVEFRVSIA